MREGRGGEPCGVKRQGAFVLLAQKARSAVPTRKRRYLAQPEALTCLFAVGLISDTLECCNVTAQIVEMYDYRASTYLS